MKHNPTTFELWPAIDLMGGVPVRLTNGDFDSKNQYHLSFESIIEQFETFASGIHIIDLDGARSGVVKNIDSVKKIIDLAGLPVQLGGGIRTLEDIQKWLDHGVERTILGTIVFDRDFRDQSADFFEINFLEKVMISVDVKNGKVMTHGWEKENKIGVFEFIEAQIKKGFRKFMVTDIEQDGTLQGASNELYRDLRRKFPDIYLLAAGGVGSIQDLEDLKATGINGTIFGKAFYEGRISIEELKQFNNEK